MKFGISRMLPSELVFLGHPQLKMLWHARRAEKALLTYRVEGVLSKGLNHSFYEVCEYPEAFDVWHCFDL